jgi:hypothetical protein
MNLGEVDRGKGQMRDHGVAVVGDIGTQEVLSVFQKYRTGCYVEGISRTCRAYVVAGWITEVETVTILVDRIMR